MLQFNLSVIFFSVLVILILYLLNAINNNLKRAIAFLISIDYELFHVAQEQNPDYGICNNCGRRAIVRNIVPREPEKKLSKPDIFYCQKCWWLSDDMIVADEKKHYKDRMTQDDIYASRVGPG
jgi:hypothetical protein